MHKRDAFARDYSIGLTTPRLYAEMGCICETLQYRVYGVRLTIPPWICILLQILGVAIMARSCRAGVKEMRSVARSDTLDRRRGFFG